MGKYLANAELVVEGKVLDETFAIRNATSGSIETVHTILIDQVLKGSATTNSIEVHTPGGRLDDMIESVSHGSTLGGGQQGIFLLSSNTSGASLGNATGGYHLHGGNAGKITRLKYDDDYEAIHWGELDKYKSWRKLREQVGASLGVDLTIHALTASELASQTLENTFCVKLDNPVPDITNKTVEFDVLAKSSIQGLRFSYAEVLIKYPIENLGGFIVDREKVVAEKGDISDDPAYSTKVDDKAEDELKLTVEAACGIEEPYYVLDTVYEKLATLTVEVEQWGDFGTMNVSEFPIDGIAKFANPPTLQGSAGCTEFDDLCGEGEFGIVTCAVRVQQGAGPQGAGVFDKVTFTGLRFGDLPNNPNARISIPNADDGGTSSINIPINDVNHIDSWIDTQIVINIGSIASNPNFSDGSPFASGTWIVHPDPNDFTLSCSAGVRVDYALDNTVTPIAGGGGNRHKMVAMAQENATPSLATDYDWEYYIDNDIVTMDLLPPNLTAGEFEAMVERVLCRWEVASGIELSYGGFLSKGSSPHPRASFITFVPKATIGGKAGFTIRLKAGGSFCAAPIAAPDYFGSIHFRSTIQLSNDFGWWVGSNNIPFNEVDLESVLMHEFGHSLLMGHEWDGQLFENGQGIMFWKPVTGQIRREIDPDNAFGIALERSRTSGVTEPDPRICFVDYYQDVNSGGCTLSPVSELVKDQSPFNYNSFDRMITTHDLKNNSEWILHGYDISGRIIEKTKFFLLDGIKVDPSVKIVQITDLGNRYSFSFKTL